MAATDIPDRNESNVKAKGEEDENENRNTTREGLRASPNYGKPWAHSADRTRGNRAAA
jgi:hypothetical protein